MADAERSIRAAMTMLEAAPTESLPRSVRHLIAQAGRAVVKSRSHKAVATLDEALRVLDESAMADEG
jgi:hypothetical protein